MSSEMAAPAEVMAPQEIVSTFEEVNTAGRLSIFLAVLPRQAVPPAGAASAAWWSSAFIKKLRRQTRELTTPLGLCCSADGAILQTCVSRVGRPVQHSPRLDSDDAVRPTSPLVPRRPPPLERAAG